MKSKRKRQVRRELFIEQLSKCAGCGKEFNFEDMTIDHIKPRSKGGTDAKFNLQLMCSPCNNKKADRLLPPKSFRLYI